MAADPDEDYFASQFAAIQQRIAVKKATRRRRTGWTFVAAGAAASLAITGGTIAVIQATETEKSGSFCYQADSTSAAHTEVGAAYGDGRIPELPVIADRVGFAEEQCGLVWQIGFFSPEGPSDGGDYAVPEMFTCVLRDGRLGVFPVDDDADCASLNLIDP